MFAPEDRALLEEAFAFCVRKLDSWTGLTGYPSMTMDGCWQTVGNAGFAAGFMPAAGGWVVGFLPGMHWLAFRRTRRDIHRAEGERLTLPIARRKDDTTTHDLGFVFSPSFVLAHALTGDERFREPAVAAARALARRYNPVGRFIRAWGELASPDAAGSTTIDAMMNLALLFWASDQTGDTALREAATEHADSTLGHLIRADDWTFHVYDFDPTTGQPLRGHTHQGLHDRSRWARGQAWGLYGFAATYRATCDPRYLDAACRLADAFLGALPADGVPFWDFDDAAIPDAMRDTSAGAAAASGLLEIVALHPVHDVAERYHRAATLMLSKLYLGYSSLDQPLQQGILLHATWHKPANHGVDCSLIFGDYYFMEALDKALALTDNHIR